MAACMRACMSAYGCVYVCWYVGYICQFWDLDNEGRCYVISLCHFNYYEADILIEHSYLSTSVSQSWRLYNR